MPCSTPITPSTTSTSFNELSMEIFERIFDNFDNKGKEYISTLHSCLLVNKNWSLYIIKLLYSNPFYYCKELKNIDKIIDTLLLCLNQPELEMLVGYGIINSSKGGISAYYDYPKYLKNLYYRGFLSIINSWLTTKSNAAISNDQYSEMSSDSYMTYTSTASSQFEAIVRVLLNMISRKSERLEKLHVGSTNLIWDKKELSCMYLLMSHSLGVSSSGFLNGLCSNLNNIYLTVDCPMSNFLPLLSKQSKNLTNLGVMMDLHRKSCFNHSPPPTDNSDVKNICTLISSQRNLQHFQTMFFSSTSLLISALYTQHKSLRSLDFYWVNFEDCTPLVELTEFKQLEILKFRNCFNIKREICEPLLDNEWEKLCCVTVVNTDCFILREWSRKISIKMSNRNSSLNRNNNNIVKKSNIVKSNHIIKRNKFTILTNNFKRDFKIE
ncbi:14914_t:CDS:2, partial [Funneliformis caledonium]